MIGIEIILFFGVEQTGNVPHGYVRLISSRDEYLPWYNGRSAIGV